MNQIFYPTIDLFTYKLKNALNLSSNEIRKQKQEFLAQFPPEVQVNINDPETETGYQPLFIDPKTLHNDFDLKTNNPTLEGYCYPVVLNDVYGVQIDCSVNNLTEPQATESLAEIKTEIEAIAQSNSLTIGKTWLISGWLAEEDLANAETIAQACYQSTFGGDLEEWKENLYAQSSFLTGKLFELWQTQASSSIHIVILLLPNQDKAKQAASFNKDWMGLFCYRHKITWAYAQSRLIKSALINHYRKVEENTQVIKQNRYRDKNPRNTENLLNNIQDILNQYTIDLLNLAWQKQIIEINFINYQKRVEIIQQKAQEELNYLNLFSDLAKDKYLTQIDKDTENMQLGTRLLENNLKAISSRIELEKEERERTFQALVTIIGTGIAGASLVKAEDIDCQEVFKDQFSLVCQLPIKQLPIMNYLAVPLLLIILFGSLGWLVKWVMKKF